MPVDYERWNLDGAGGIYAYRASRWVRIGSYEMESTTTNSACKCVSRPR